MKIIKINLIILLFILANSLMAQQIRTFSLQEAISFAMENNYTLINSQMDVETARYKVKESTAIGLPQIDASVNYNDNIQRAVMIIPDFYNVPIQFGTKYDGSLGASASQLIFSGEYIVGLQAAKTYLEKTDIDFFKNKVEVKQKVADSYYAALSATDGLTVVDSTLRITRKLANETRQVYEVGFAEETDVDQLELLVTNLEATQNYLNNQLIVAHAFLKFYMGLNDADSLVLTDKMETIIDQKKNSGMVMNPFEISKNVDYRSINKQKELSLLQVKLAKSAYLPSLSANLNYQTQAQREQWDFFNKDGMWYNSSVFGVSMKIPIFSSGMRYAKVKQAQIAFQQVEVSQKQMTLQLDIQYSTAKNEYLNAYNVYVNKQKSRLNAEKIYKKTTEKYSVGMATSLDLLNTHNQFMNTESEYINAELALLKAGEELEKILTKSDK
ncbi:MAG: TolC family protein [Bacteroidales bacterium]|nr:TolC family protein [Bacteroidales bacterium]